MDKTFISREVERLVNGVAVSDGAGVRLLRVLTQDLQRRLDPFLMLDEFRSDNQDDYIAGFPDHPHRGFETVTYMLDGRMRHRDSTGQEGLLGPGGVQWMTAGRGVVHSELPEQEDGLMHGFQLWVNLPAKRKMIDAWYRDIPASDIPQSVTEQGSTLRRIAGEGGAIRREDTDPLYLDLHLKAGGTEEVTIPAGYNAFIYVYAGEVSVGERAQTVTQRQMAVLANLPSANGVRISASGEARLLVIAGQPLNEPIAQWGPFVMNSREELEQAFDDYRSGRF
ncbi:pirin family protein [uncultured Aquitalea sp.]|uniref:pirin family protein n=1 Tax=uncultured Aquitalea sp. TaxID=540272 RepID=UPI0025E73DE0|nr:pirin family protein [uncultured Aquitalea sp.]